MSTICLTDSTACDQISLVSLFLASDQILEVGTAWAIVALYFTFTQQDYWLSVLYKMLVGTKVLYVMDSLQEGRYVRAYAHCAKPP